MFEPVMWWEGEELLPPEGQYAELTVNGELLHSYLPLADSGILGWYNSNNELKFALSYTPWYGTYFLSDHIPSEGGVLHSLDKLQSMNDIQTCCLSGEIVYLNYGADLNKYMSENRFSFGTQFWMRIYNENKDNPLWFRYKGESNMTNQVDIYERDGVRIKEPSKVSNRGYAGRYFEITYVNGSTVNTDNLWNQGRMPKWLTNSILNNVINIREV